jgi:2'-5' RNA ligase
MRAFLGSRLGDRATAAVDDVGRSLRAVLGGRGWEVSWTAPRKIHLTWKFLGDVAPDRKGEIVAAARPLCRGRAPIAVGVRGVGAFPPRGAPRVIWVGLADPAGAVAELAAAIEDRMAGIGFPREGRPFHAHVTIGRVRRPGGGRLADVASDLGPSDCGEATIDSVLLFRSDLEAGTYEVLERMTLRGEKA